MNGRPRPTAPETIPNLKHELVDCPEIKPKLKAYMKEFDLNFGCFDIAVTPSGEFVFFECNSNGQWLWIEEFTGAPIGKAIAELLLTACSLDRKNIPVRVQ